MNHRDLLREGLAELLLEESAANGEGKQVGNFLQDIQALIAVHAAIMVMGFLTSAQTA